MEYFSLSIRVPKPTRTWFRFSLRASMVVLTLICVAVAYYVRDQSTRREQATVNGKYSHLLTTIRVPKDEASYGLFRDDGYWSGTSYRGSTELPPGYWVYVAPTWYIWRDGDSSASADVDPWGNNDNPLSANPDASSYGGSSQARIVAPAGVTDDLTTEFETDEFDGAF